jgi:hypothetical protein
MEQQDKFRTLKSIGFIYDNARSSKLEPGLFTKVKKELQHLSAYFHVSQNQSLLISLVFALNYKGQTVEIKDFIEYLDCNPMKLLEFSDDFEFLYKKGILTKEKSSHKIKLALSNDQFQINEKVTEAILDNKPCPKIVKKEKYKDIYEVLEKLYRLGDERQKKEVPTFMMLAQAHEIITNNLNFPLVKKLHDFQYVMADTYILIYLIWKTLIGNKTTDLCNMINDIFDLQTLRVKHSQNLVSGKHILIKNNLVEIEESTFFIDAEIKLTDKSINMLQDEGIKIFLKKVYKDNIIESAKIKPRKLFFNDSDNSSLDLLKSLLSENNLKEIQERLSKKCLPIGVTALLHGAPGTGKTETVYQIARETQRDIFKVDISESKSAWLGESEKRIKAIFTDYRTHAKSCEKTPILLFNEADAIISKRKEIYSSVSQTENAIQNILLEELENFEGVFLATTNLIKNLDSAFDRRFLFKIEFPIPDVCTKAKIWQSKLPKLTVEETTALALQFNFSGGQIDNIVRKYEIYELLHGAKMVYSELVEYCNSEILLKSNIAKIGFKK